MSWMKRLIHEVHRRSLWQVLGIYGAGSWVALQVVETLASSMGLPDWFQPVCLGLLIVGFPIVMATAFMQEGVPGRDRGTGASESPPAGALPEPAEGLPGPSEPAETVAADRPTVRARRRGPFTWRNALSGGLLAFALLGVLAAGWLLSRALGIGPAATLQARGVIGDRALVVLADFEAADSEIAAAATEALRVDLSQSSAIRLADPALVAEALERMERDPAEPLTAELAREVARREGAAAVIHGEISRAGEGYVFSARLVSAADGGTLTSQRETANGPGDVIAAIEGLSKKLRERIGESMGSIRADEPLERVTTDNLEALELYSRARPLPSNDALPMYEQAIALDSGFAMAWQALAVRLRNRQTERARAVEAQTRAYELRERLTRRERHLTAGMYYSDVLYEPERAVREYEAMLELDPLDETAINNSGVVYSDLRREDLAEQSYLKMTELAPDVFVPGFWNLIQARVGLGKFAEAWETIDTIAARFSGRSAAYVGAIVASNEGDFDRAERLLAEVLDSIPPLGGFSARVYGDLGAMLAARGRLGEASRRFEAAAAIARAASAPDYWEDAIQAAWLELAVPSRPEAALRVIEAAQAEIPLESLAPLDRPYGPLAELHARAGDVGTARRLITELESEVPPEYHLVIREEIARAEGEIALAEDRLDDAIEAFRRADIGQCTICALTGLALAYDRAGPPDSAIAVYARYAETPFPDRYASYAYPLGPALGPAYERLGQLYDEAGDLEKAAEYYAKFVELWAEADEELQPRVRAAQARLEEIVRARG